ncbi:helix-turn-helix domain-containing protein [Chitinophaga sp. OAE865]|uniref:helix-turn-helix domain-containing protein n=1 Tax=Chitinophaga sp. OAE865 TaxID=2817898 RepID=UPI001AE9AF4B
MDKRRKYSFEQKLAIVRAVWNDHQSVSSVARRYGCSRFCIQQWLEHYRIAGKASLKLQVGLKVYTSRFRVKVVEEILNKPLSLMEASAIFGISSAPTIYNWLCIYKREGRQGLLMVGSGQKKQPMKRKTSKVDQNLTTEQQELAALKAENEWLRTENAYLKKLDALMKEEQAQNKKKKEQKPSGN